MPAYVERVVRVLELLGFMVQGSVIAKGQHKRLLYCGGEESAVCVDELKRVLVEVEAARERGLVSGGLVVSNHGWTKPAAMLAKANDIKLRRISRLVDFAAYDMNIEAEFPEMALGQRCAEFRTHEGFSLWRILEPLDAVAILGGLGAGKTTFCRNHASRLASYARMYSPDYRTPVLLDLSTYTGELPLRELMADKMLELGAGVDAHLLVALESLGRFEYLLDGLDELGNRRPDLMERVVLQIQELAQSPNARVLFTATPGLFERCARLLEAFVLVRLPEWNVLDRDSVGYDLLKDYANRRCFHRPSNPHQYTHNQVIARVRESAFLPELVRVPLLMDQTFELLDDAKAFDSLHREYHSRLLEMISDLVEDAELANVIVVKTLIGVAGQLGHFESEHKLLLLKFVACFIGMAECESYGRSDAANHLLAQWFVLAVEFLEKPAEVVSYKVTPTGIEFTLDNTRLVVVEAA